MLDLQRLSLQKRFTVQGSRFTGKHLKIVGFGGETPYRIPYTLHLYIIWPQKNGLNRSARLHQGYGVANRCYKGRVKHL